MTDCACGFCHPDGFADAWEAQTAAVVQEHGWMVQVVGAGTCDCGEPECDPDAGGPAFAYTIGLWHQARHPELLISGQKAALMHSALNAAARGVMKGNRLVPGMTLENVIGRYPVLVDEVSEVGLQETVLGAHHFHHRLVDAVQLVWPDTSGRWGWQPGAAPFAEELQPQTWRVPAQRLGPVAVDPDWLLPVPADTMTLSCRCVVDEGAPVRWVVRLDDEAWVGLCSRDHDLNDPEPWISAWHVAHLVRQAPSVLELADLGLDEGAYREDVWSPWVRTAS